jgi:hypothetical protein
MKRSNNYLHFLGISMLYTCLFSCSDPNGKVEEPSNPASAISTNDELTTIQEKSDMTNPAIMLGSDLGSIMRSFYGIGDFDRMLQFTSTETIERFGRDSLKSWYRNLDLRMEMKLLSVTQEPPYQILHYECIDKATKIIRRLPVIIENDTARVAPPFPDKATLFE